MFLSSIQFHLLEHKLNLHISKIIQVLHHKNHTISSPQVIISLELIQVNLYKICITRVRFHSHKRFMTQTCPISHYRQDSSQHKKLEKKIIKILHLAAHSRAPALAARRQAARAFTLPACAPLRLRVAGPSTAARARPGRPLQLPPGRARSRRPLRVLPPGSCCITLVW
jgi:hypothetical protein